METITITLNGPMKKFIERKAAELSHGSVEKYLQALVAEKKKESEKAEAMLGWTHLTEDQKKKARKRVEELIQEGLDSGPATPMTAKDWEKLRREAMKKLRATARKTR